MFNNYFVTFIELVKNTYVKFGAKIFFTQFYLLIYSKNLSVYTLICLVNVLKSFEVFNVQTKHKITC